jgi:acyl-CoA synthetase (AMP-forming)/AMP-acid ligase II
VPATREIPFVRDLIRHGDAPALLNAERTISYAELAALTEDLAERIRGDGSRRLVLVGAQNRPGAIVAYLGALRANHVVMLVDGEDRAVVDSMIAAYDPDVVILPTSPESEHWLIEERRPGSRHDLHPDLALLLSTSGSTGSPKLVRLSHENLQTNATAIAEYLAITDSDRAATTLPMNYCYGLSVVHSHLLQGAGLVLTGLSVVDRCFWELFRRHGATSFAGVPYTFELLERVDFGAMDLPTLRYVTQAGGRMDPEQVRRFAKLGRSRGWELVVMYGQTEATARMAYLPPPLALTQPGLIGIPIPGGSFRIDGGELLYRGPNVMLGYAQAPADLALGREIHELRTGDLARENADGLFEIIGRRSAFVKVAGLRVELEQVERNLAQIGLVAAAAGTDDNLVIAVESKQSADHVRPAVLEALDLPGRAVDVVTVDALPRLATGKIDRQAVSSLGTDEGPAPAALTVDVSGTDRVRALYADVLERQADDKDSFVSLGGDSLSYVEASLGLEEILGRLPERWPTMTVAELGAVAGTNRATRGGWLRSMFALRTVETGVALRSLAILLIVMTHVGLHTLPGGAHVLLAVVGFNFARFQLGPQPRLDRLRSQLRAMARIVVPAVLWIAVLLVVSTDYRYDLHSLFLLNSIVGPPTWTNDGWQYWFVEMLVYILVAMAALTSLRWFDTAERRWPFLVPMAVLAVGLLFRYEILDFGAPHPRPVLWLFALGWAASRATNVWQRLLIVGIAGLAISGFFGDYKRELLILSGIAALTFVRSVRLPAISTPVVGVLASASLYIYLVHWQVYPKFDAFDPAIRVAAAIAAGIALWFAAERLPGTIENAATSSRDLARRFGTRPARLLRVRYSDVVATG